MLISLSLGDRESNNSAPIKFPKINSAWLVMAGAVIGWLLKTQ